MLYRSLIAAGLTVFAGSAFAADPPRPPVKVVPTIVAGPVLAGDISISLGILRGDGDSAGIFNALGRVNKPLDHPGWNLETEIFGAAVFEGGDSNAGIGTALHLWGMHTPTAAAGVFAAVAFAGSNYWTLGAEAKHFVASGSWGGSAAAVGCFSCSTGTLGLFAFTVNHYLNPNHRIGFRAAVLTDFSASSWEVGADVERRFMHPISVFGAATFGGGQSGNDIWTAKVGVRFFLDGPTDTLQSHEKRVPWTTWTPDSLLLVASP